MNFLFSLRVATRMQLLVGLALAGLVTLCFTALLQLKSEMLEDRKQKTRNLVETVIGIVEHHHRQAKEGKLPEEEAKRAARDSLRGLRYGDGNYYFVVDTDYNYVVAPQKPESEGSNVKEVKDANGKFLFQGIVSAARQGGGFVDYWFPKAGQAAPLPKLSYAALYAPWGWVLGTGIYVDDVDAEYWANATLFGGIALALLLALSLCGWAVGASVLRQLGGEPEVATAVMRRVADGDLTAEIESSQPGSLLDTLGRMVIALRRLVQEINAGADRLVRDAELISHASGEVASAAANQSDSTSAIAAAIEELTVSSNHISDSARETERNSRAAMTLSSQGCERVGVAAEAIQKMAQTVVGASGRIRSLEERAVQISSIANVIKDIAGQTNLLALNAAIEAARAGEQGRGFAVVADEVRKLAERTSNATAEIEQMILGIQGDTGGAVEAMDAALPEVEQGVALAKSASESLRAIEAGARHSLERIGDVADATREQSSASTSIAQRVEQMAQMVEETTTTIRNTADTAVELEKLSLHLKELISRFRV